MGVDYVTGYLQAAVEECWAPEIQQTALFAGSRGSEAQCFTVQLCSLSFSRLH